MNQSRGGGFVAILLAFAAFVVALLTWIAPFDPIGPSPLSPNKSEPGFIVTPIPSEDTPTTNSIAVVDWSAYGTANPSQAGDIRTIWRGGVLVEQVFVQAGSFRMGSEDGNGDEQPIHEVTLDAFWIDRTEVTNKQFAAFVADTGYETSADHLHAGVTWQHPRGPLSDLNGLDNHPVVNISWVDALAFATWASGRLPTEAEWEYAARGPQSLVYPWGNVLDSRRLNFCDVNCQFDWADKSVDDGYELTAPVATYPEGDNWIGAVDMAGNVWEWVNDWYESDYYERSSNANPPGPRSGDTKVLRGGSWLNGGRDNRSAFRLNFYAAYWSPYIGFRVVEPLSDPGS